MNAIESRLEASMMKKGLKAVVLGSAVTILALVPGVAHAGHGGPGRGPGGHAGMVEHLTEALGLSDDQRAAISGILERYRTGPLGDHRQAMRQARAALDGAIHDPAASDAQVKKASQAVSVQAEQMAVDRHHMAIEMMRVLTDEQRQKFSELRSQHGGWHGAPAPDEPEAD
jgi:Spy/CpxP family protein refolding chaperone